MIGYKGDEIRGYKDTVIRRYLSLVSRNSSLVVFCLLLVMGCGKKLSPVAPESVAPEPVKNLIAASRDGKLMIVFERPARNADGSKLTDLAGFKIFRRAVDEKTCKGCPERFDTAADIDISYPGGAVIDRNRVGWYDNNLSSGITYEYKVVGYNKDGYDGPESAKVVFVWRVPPVKPEGLEITAGDRAADLKWSRTENFYDGSPLTEPAGYNVYRREEGKGYPIDPVNAGPLKGTEFADIGLTNGIVYSYVVRAVVRSGDILIEGPSSVQVSVTPREAELE